MKRYEAFIYDWRYEDEDDKIVIRAFGRTKDKKNVLFRIEDFQNFCYFELPERRWKDIEIQLITDKICNAVRNEYKPIKSELVYRRKLYYAHVKKNEEYLKSNVIDSVVKNNNLMSNDNIVKNKYEFTKFPYIIMFFNTTEALNNIVKYIRYHPIQIPGLSSFNLIPREFESSIILPVKLCSLRNIPISSWILAEGKEIQDKESICDIELLCPWRKLKPLNIEETPKMKIMAIDLEVTSEDERKMPEVENPANIIFMCSFVIYDDVEFREVASNSSTNTAAHETVNNDSRFRSILAYIGKCNKCADEMIQCKNEQHLLITIRNVILRERPNIIIGHNIFNFDIRYSIGRAKLCVCKQEFLKMSFIKDRVCSIYDNKGGWNSKAHVGNDFVYIETEGILFIDTLPFLRRNFKLNSFKLGYVAEKFLGVGKDSLTHRDIFRGYRLGQLDEIGKYCVIDSLRCLQVFLKLQIFITLVESSSINNVPMIYLYTKGQQIKMFLYLYKKCLHKGIVLETGIWNTEGDSYEGANVLEIIPGLHSNIGLVDFVSLYASIIISHNTCYTTLAIDDKIPDEDCIIRRIVSHKNCIHDSNRDKGRVICSEKTVRFIKPEYCKGVLPEIEEELTEKRKKTKEKRDEVKKQQLKLEKEISEEKYDDKQLKEIGEKIILLIDQYNILDKRQVECKLSGNSFYGATGVKKGYIPCWDIASFVTKLGRESIEKAQKMTKEEFKGIAIAGDTDSLFVKFPDNYTTLQVYDACKGIEKRSKEIFPYPMWIEFDKILRNHLHLTKKRYMYQGCDKNGKLFMVIGNDGLPTNKPLIEKKGVVSQRGDNPQLVKIIYEATVMDIFNRLPEEQILYNLIRNIDKLFNRIFQIKDFVITKSIKKEGMTQDILLKKYKDIVGDEVDEEEISEKRRKEIIKEIKDVDKTGLDQYYLASQSHVVLAEKLRKRGIPVGIGSRIDYVITTKGNSKSKQGEKIEDYEYFCYNRNVLDLDRLYVLEHSLLKPIEQLLELALNIKGFMKSQLELRLMKNKVLQSVKELFKPQITIEQRFEEENNEIEIILD